MSTDKYALNLRVSFQTPNIPRISYDYLEPNLKRCAAVLAVDCCIQALLRRAYKIFQRSMANLIGLKYLQQMRHEFHFPAHFHPWSEIW
jgi:hypothetical protein